MAKEKVSNSKEVKVVGGDVRKENTKDVNYNKDNESKDVVVINYGKHFEKVRDNPWIISTIVLGLVVVFLVIFSFGGGSEDFVNENTAANNLVSFIKSRNEANGNVKIVSTMRDGQLYKVILDYQGQNIPLYVTLDGKKWVAGDVISLDGTKSEDGGNLGSNFANVEIGDSPVMGKADAPVTIVEFSDYECPFCGKFFSQTLSQIDNEYIKTGKVKLVYKDFPLDFHPNAQKAAEAARCVREQKGDDGYWKIHDKMFENQQELGVENYKKWARSFGVVGSKFDECLDKGKYADAVKKDYDYGQQLRVTGTPGFFINGKLVSGAQPFNAFKQIIDAELEIK